MKTLQELKREVAIKSLKSRVIPENEFRDLMQVYETRGRMTDGIIKAGALMTKRYIINKGQEGDVSAQINGLASLILFAIAATDRGESFMSKALATSGFFKGATKK